MKKLFFMLCFVAICFMAASCSQGFKSEEKRLSDDLVSYTEKNIDGNIWMGVKDNAGRIIITPAAYSEISADEYFITCKNESGGVTVFTITSGLFGKFDIFTHWENQTQNYYVGVNGVCSMYFFPETKETVVTKHEAIPLPEHLLIKGESNWKIRSYTGQTHWTLPQPFVIVKNKSVGTDWLIAILPASKKPVVFFDKDGKEVKRISFTQWKALEKKLTILTTADDGSVLTELDTKNTPLSKAL